MKILFDQGTPVPLRRHLPEHTVATAYEQGWSNIANGELLSAYPENQRFRLFLGGPSPPRPPRRSYSDRLLAPPSVMATSCLSPLTRTCVTSRISIADRSPSSC